MTELPPEVNVAILRHLGLSAGPTVVTPYPSEKDVQGAIVSLACGSKSSPGLGFRRYSTSQYRASHVDEGIADLKLFADLASVGLWWETKTYVRSEWKAGRLRLKPLSGAQADFRDRCETARELHGWGALAEFYAMLWRLGFVNVSGYTIVLRTRPDRDRLAAFLREEISRV